MAYWMPLRILVCLALLVLAGCARQASSANDSTASAANPAAPTVLQPVDGHVGDKATGAAGPSQKGATGEVDYSCSTDAQCTIKDIGNCCGAYPACVNRDSPTFPEQVQAACAAQGLSGVCGFPAINGCRCIEQRCEGVTDLQVVPDVRQD